MVIDPRLFIHDADRITLDALKAIPGFTQLLKAFMKIWNEKQYAVINMSSNLRLSEEQFPEYYNMLPPICEKLGIEVPELYLECDGFPNAYTSGENNPIIVITSGLVEKLPPEVVASVLAHECGHIACHHVLYHTMGRILFSGGLLGVSAFAGSEIASLLTSPINAAFSKWLRCSDLSADRVAAVCSGSPDHIVKMCMFYAGGKKAIGPDVNMEAFLKQAEEYRQMVDDSKWNKILESAILKNAEKPLSAVRALECHEWAKGDDFRYAVEYTAGESMENYKGMIPILENSSSFITGSKEESEEMFKAIGFRNIRCNRVIVPEKKSIPGEVLTLHIGDETEFKKGAWFSAEVPIVIDYYEPKSEEEIAAEHPDERRLPHGFRYYSGMHFLGVKYEFENAGFLNIITEPVVIEKPEYNFKAGNSVEITVNGNDKFEKGIWTDINAEVRIKYGVPAE